MSNKMTIADGLKYATFLEERGNELRAKIRQTDSTRISQRVVSSTEATQVVEQTEFTISPKALMSEFDANSKELRLVRQAIEKANHTVELAIDAQF